MEKAKIPLIRTFGRKHGKKLSMRQQWLVDNLLPALLPVEKNAAGAILEIGFGNGEHLIKLAERNPDKIIIGAEPFINGVAQLLSRVTDDKNEILPQYKNIRIWPNDVREFLTGKNFNFEEIYILHPDPWPKARHEKRRLLSAEFLKILNAFISKDQSIIIGTDHTDYYNWILEQVAHAGLAIKSRARTTIKTKYQEKNMFGSPRTLSLEIISKP